MTIEAGKTAPIIDNDDRLLSDIWKAKAKEQLKGVTGFFPFSSGFSGSTGGGDEDPSDTSSRPQLSDIQYLGSETYYDSAGMQFAKSKFRIYNSSGENLEKYALVITLSDQQGGSE